MRATLWFEGQEKPMLPRAKILPEPLEYFAAGTRGVTP